MSFWSWLVALLVWLSSDPAAIDREAPRAAAAVAAARASMLLEVAPPPGPAPKSCDCGETCVAGVWKPDGKIPQPCKCDCPRCVAERAKSTPKPQACPDGKCPPVLR